MKIFSAKQLKEADERTLKAQGISSDELMERAGSLIFKEIDSYFKEEKPPVKIFCGIGNNGGDGLVTGRLLLESGYDVSFFIVNYSEKRSPDFLLNYQRLTDITEKWPTFLTAEDPLPELKKDDLVIDAIFGIGLNRSIYPWVAKLIEVINTSRAIVLAVDMPSGLHADEAFGDKGAIIKAAITFTFQSAKLSFFLPGAAPYVGQLKIIDLGLDAEFLSKTTGIAELIRKQEVRSFYRPREKFSHKGTYGHALLAGGSYGKIGSICLATTATLKSGAGMASVFIPKCGYISLQTALPEAMVITDKNENHLSEVNFDFQPAVICFGVGAGQDAETKTAFENLLEKVNSPMVIDADGLNILSANPELLELIPENSVLTPHPKELERLMGSWKDDFEKLESAKEFSKKNNIILVIKGAYTITVFKEELFINTSGNPGMATAGSGDVLSGIITGLISQAYDPLTAAIFGVYLHGVAGDIAAGKLGYEGVLSGDIAAHAGPAFLEILKQPAT